MPASPEPGEGREPRGGLWRLLALYVLSLAAAAVVTPLVYWGVERWAAGGESELASYLAGKELPRYFDRLRWLFVLIALPWLCRAAGLTGRRALGLVGGTDARRAATGWLAVGFAMVAGIAVGQVFAGIVRLAPEARVASALAAGLAAGLVSAALIAFFEELVFRGIVFRLCARALPAAAAVPLAAAIFAVLHFQRVPGDAWSDGTPVTWTSGFTVAWRSVAAMPTTVDPAIGTALFLAGAILCVLYLRHGTLLAPIGLHAGWVWAAQLHRRFLDAAAEAPGVAFWGGDDLIEGILPLVLLGLLLVALVARGPLPATDRLRGVREPG